MNRFIINGKEYTDENIQDGRMYVSNSIILDELPIDTLDITIDFSENKPTIYKPSDAEGFAVGGRPFVVLPFVTSMIDDPLALQYGQRVEWYHDEDFMGAFYFSSAARTGKYTYALSFVSAMGLLDTAKDHYGGVYNGVSAEALAAEIIGDVVPYTVDERIKHIPLYGWLPIASRRDNIHQMLFAIGGSVLKDADGNIYLTALDATTPKVIPDSHIAYNGTVEYGAEINHVSVTEHSYAMIAQVSTESLFEGEVGDLPIVTPNGNTVSGALVTFSGPMFDLQAANCEILESGVNYAVLSPSQNAVLTGKPYVHTTRVVTRGKAETRSLISQSDNTITISDATLISLVNADAVADRMMAYYGRVKTVSQDIYTAGEKPGDPVTFADPYDEEATGFLQSLDIPVANMLKASSTTVLDYNPTPPGNYYNHTVVLTGSGTWTVPKDAKGTIRVTIIGGGQGGQSGASGKKGQKGVVGGSNDNYMQGAPGDGGEGGEGGEGGKIFSVNIDASPGDTFNYSVGAGGAGGTARSTEQTNGEYGTDSSFGAYTSAQGTSSPNGYINVINGVVYGNKGIKGVNGGKGSVETIKNSTYQKETPTLTYDGIMYYAGEARDHYWVNGKEDGILGGGGGGGAAAGADGSPGGSPYQTSGIWYSGKGGNGATATIAGENGVYGSGGNGGNGGGGSGGSGHIRYNFAEKIGEVKAGDIGTPGLGSAGGKGGDGVIIINY